MAYLIVKFVHVLLAITAVGANITYAVWFARANAHPESAPTILRGIKLIDDRIANPAYGFLLLTGIGLVWVGHYPWNTLWIDVALALYAVLLVVAAGFYTPTLKRQIAVVATNGVGDPAAKALSARGNTLAAIMGILVLGILIMMVFKPT